jgi:hypothetical protein
MIDFENGKSYVGITSGTAHARLLSHLREAERYGAAKLVGNALLKYAGAYTVTELAYSDDWKMLCALEKQYIAHYRTKAPSGYNMTDGGDGSKGLRWNEDQRARASARLLGNTRATGCVHTEDGIRRLRDAMLGNSRSVGNKKSAEGAARISRANMGNDYARPKTLQHRARLQSSQALRRARERKIPYCEFPRETV